MPPTPQCDPTRLVPGDRVIFKHNSDSICHFSDCCDPRQFLTLHRMYTVRRIEMHSYHTKLYLVETPGHAFNSCAFEAVDAFKNSP